MQARRSFWPLLFVALGYLFAYLADAPRVPEITVAVALVAIGLYFIARAAIWYFRRADAEEFAWQVFTKPRGWTSSEQFEEDYPEAARYLAIGVACVFGAFLLVAQYAPRHH